MDTVIVFYVITLALAAAVRRFIYVAARVHIVQVRISSQSQTVQCRFPTM